MEKAGLKRPRSAAFGAVADTGILQVQFAFDAAAGLVADLAAVIEIGDAGALGLHELQLQRRGGVAHIAMHQVLAGGDPIAKELFAKYKSVRMPNLAMSAEETDAVLTYIEQQSQAVTRSAPAGSLSAR